MSHPPSATALAELTQALAANAERYDRSGQFPADNFSLLHRHGLLSLTVPRALGGGGADVIYDAVGGDYCEPALRAMNWNGRYLVIGFPAGIRPLKLMTLPGRRFFCKLRELKSPFPP